MKTQSLLASRWLSLRGVLGATALLLLPSTSQAAPVIALQPVPIPQSQPSEDIVPVEKPRPVSRSLRLAEASALVNAVAGRNAHNVSGRGLCVAVLDTGINSRHVDFANKIVLQRNYTSDNGGSLSNAEDGHGHGTNVAGIVMANGTHVGIAPGANLAVFKVLSDFGSGNRTSIVQALEWIRDNGDAYNISVINMSLGNSTNAQTESPTDEYLPVIKQLSAKNIAVVVSAGNGFYENRSVQGMASPGIIRECISVGAVYDANIGRYSYASGATANTTGVDRITPFSQRLHESVSATNRTDIFAPGAALTSAGIGGTTASSVMHGTSQAAPIIAGSVLLFQEKYKALYGTLPPVSVLESLMRNNAKILNDGDDEDDNVVNTNKNYPRVDVKATLDAMGAAASTFSISNASVTEAVGGTTATLTVTANPALVGTATVNYSTVNGTATAGQDYIASSGTLTFPPGVTTQTITIPILDDGFVESGETFIVRLSNAVGATVPTLATDGTVSIADNDSIRITSPGRNFDFPSSGGTYPVRIETNSPGASSMKVYRRPMRMSVSTTPLAIPQNGTYATQTLSVPADALTRGLFFLVAGNHPVPREVVMELVSPSGTTYSLDGSTYPSAPWSFTYDVGSIITSSFLPGNWTLRATDTTNNGNSGSITSWGFVIPSTTEPDTLISNATYDSTNARWGGEWNLNSTPNGYYSLVARSFDTNGVRLGETINDRLLVQTVNRAPVVQSVELAPALPSTTSLLTASYQASDAENDTLTPTYVWRNNDTIITGEKGKTLDLSKAGNGDKGDKITVSVSVNDGTNTSASVTSQIATVQNTAPSISGVTLSPTAPLTGDTLTATVSGAIDADSDSLTYSYVWKKNDVTIVGESSKTLDLSKAGNGDKGDKITVTVVANDGTTDSASVTSEGVSIGSSTPSITSVTLSPASPLTSSILSTTVVANDIDNDKLSYTYVWRKNGNFISGEGGQTLDLSKVGNGDDGDSITVTVTANDGTSSSTAVESASVSISNRTPQVDAVTPQGASDKVGDKRTFSITVSDANGAGDIKETWLLVNERLNWSEGATFIYVPNAGSPNAGSPTNGLLYLRRGDAFLAPITIGAGASSSAVLDNGAVRVVASEVTVTVSGNSLTLNIPATIREGLVGNNTLFGLVMDRADAKDTRAQEGDNGFVPFGSYTVTSQFSGANVAPALSKLSPGATSTSLLTSGMAPGAQRFVFYVSDENGTSDIESVWFMAGKQLNWSNSATIVYQPKTRRLFLRSDDGSTFLGGGQIGQAGIIENSQVRIDLSKVSVNVYPDGKSFGLTLLLQAKKGLLGQNTIWLRAQDKAGLIPSNSNPQGYVQSGTWSVVQGKALNAPSGDTKPSNGKS